MRNPYDDQNDDVDLRIGRGAAYGIIFVFLLLITLPPLYRNLSEGFAPIKTLFTPQSDESLYAHLRAAEKSIEDAPFADPTRRAMQGVLTASPLREGNRQTLIGRDGWLYFRTALDSLSGYGPLRPEPDSVAKDPRRGPWRSPLDAITIFAGQLAESDTELLLVPLPVKPMIYPEHLDIEADAPLAHPDAAAFYAQLSALPNVKVLDPSDALWQAKADTQLFLKQDTHWTPAGMELVAKTIATEIGKQDETSPALSKETRQSRGDLVEKLDVTHFAPESVEATVISGADIRDHSSPIVLLGDSFTNIYSDAIGLDWGASAGLAEHLAHQLGSPLDTIAINGGAATEVRAVLAKRKGAATLMKDKQLVVWTIAARDLFLSASAATEARVEWKDVEFDTRQPDPIKSEGAPAPALQVRAKLLTKSAIDDPRTTAYTALLYAAEYELLETLQGAPPETDDGRFVVNHWAFRDRKMLPSADYVVGSERSMWLEPFETQTTLQSLEVSDQSGLFAPTLWEISPPESEGAIDTTANIPAASPLIPIAGCSLWALLLGVVMFKRGFGRNGSS